MALLVTLVARGRLEFTTLRCVWAVATMTSSCTCTSARLCCRFKIEFALLCAFNRIYWGSVSLYVAAKNPEILRIQ